MRLLRLYVVCAAGLLGLIWSCSESNFSSSSSKEGPSDSSEGTGQSEPCNKDDDGPCVTDGTPNSSGTPGSCVQGDKVNFNWSGPEKDCIVGQNKTYNFDTHQCAAMRPAQFTCDWNTVKQELTKRGLLTDVLKNESAAGAKLVTCGQSSDGNRIVVQWLSLAEGGSIDCSYNGDNQHITTGCYTLYGQNEKQPAPAANDAERAKQVYDCMNTL